MRGVVNQQLMMLTPVQPDHRVPQSHPLRTIKELADVALRALSPTFDEVYAEIGRPSIPPERLLKASILMALYTVRSERLFCEQLDYNILFRWFLDMDMVEDSFDHSTFSKNRARLLAHDVAGKFFAAVVGEADSHGLLSDEHFSVDGTLIEAWASMKSFRPRDEAPEDRDPPDDPGNPSVDFHGESRSNATHQSTTDPEARLARKGPGKEAKLAYCANALMENRNGLLVDLRVVEATGTAERDTAIEMLDEALVGAKRRTVAGDKGYDTADFVEASRAIGVTPHVAQNKARKGGSAIDGRTTRHKGYELSQRIRKRSEEIFGWVKTIGGFRKTRFKGLERTQFAAYLVGAAYNLLRVAKIIRTAA